MSADDDVFRIRSFSMRKPVRLRLFTVDALQCDVLHAVHRCALRRQVASHFGYGLLYVYVYVYPYLILNSGKLSFSLCNMCQL